MSQQELLKRVVRVLDAARVEYMVTGSVVSSLQGEPRSTHDVDVVVANPASAARLLVAAFPPPDYYLDEHSILEAIRNRSMFNLLEVSEGNKVDFWLLTDEPFDQSRFSRRQQWSEGDLSLQVSRPEDTILMKLRWAEMSGGSEKQFGDALRVYEVQYRSLDLAYMDAWASTLGIGEWWQRLKNEAVVPE
jgi:hypothetical protein